MRSPRETSCWLQMFPSSFFLKIFSKKDCSYPSLKSFYYCMHYIQWMLLKTAVIVSFCLCILRGTKRLVSVNVCSVEGNSADIFVSEVSPGILVVKRK